MIASHANEAATRDGMVIDGTRTATFIEATEATVHVPLSGRTMHFDGDMGAVLRGAVEPETAAGRFERHSTYDVIWITLDGVHVRV